MSRARELHSHPRSHRDYLNLRDPRDPRENPIANTRRPTSTEYDFILHPVEELPRPKEQVKTKVSMTPDFFQQYYNDHQDNNHWTGKFGKPGVVGDLGILLSLTPLSCDLMGWRGADPNGFVSIGAYMYFGGILLFFSGFLEFLIGNTFAFAVYMSFGAFWFTLATTLQPSSDASIDGLTSQPFNAGVGFLMVFMGLLCVIFLICALKTDIAHVVVFLSLILAFGFLTGQHFHGAMGNLAEANKLRVCAGASLFVTSMTIWWIFFAGMLEALEFPFKIPTGNLSGMFSAQNFQRMPKEYTYP